MTVNFEYETTKELQVENVEQLIRDVIEEALDYENCPYDAEVNVLFTDDEGIWEINKEQRGIDRPTDVLSFPMLSLSSPSAFSEIDEVGAFDFNPESGELMLGDIVLSVDKIKEQAYNYGHGEKRETAFLVAHSMLHLFGYDHETDEERQVMERKQEEILEHLDIRR